MYTTNDNQLNSSICVEAQRQIDRHYTAVVPKIEALCSASALPEEVTQAIIADFNDILQDSYRGLRLSIEGIELLAAKTTQQQWKRLQSPALLCLIDEYNSIGAFMLTNKDCLQDIFSNPQHIAALLQEDASGITAVTLYEVAKMQGADNWRLFSIAVTNWHVLALLFLSEGLCIPIEQLHGIEPAFLAQQTLDDNTQLLDILRLGEETILQKAEETKKRNEGRKRNPIAGITDNGGNLIPEEAQAKTQGAPAEPEAEPTDDDVIEEYTDTEKPHTIAQYQNITEMLSSPLQVNSRYKDATARLLPLRQAIEQQLNEAKHAQKRLEEVQKNPNHTQQDLTEALQVSQRADNLIASQTYIMQVFTGIATLANKQTPNGAVTDYYDYGVIPANDFIRLCTGDSLNADGTLQSIGGKQKLGILRAANYLSTLRCQASETILKPKIVKDENGNKVTKYIEQKEHYIFTPAVINFRSVTGEEVPPSEAVSVSVQIYRNIVTGRRQERAEIIDEHGKKKLLPIKQPKQHILTDTQLYAFSTDEEKRLLNTLLSKNHKDEAELLADIFDYNSRIAVVRGAYNDAVEAQRLHLMQLSTAVYNQTATEYDAKKEELEKKINEAKQNIKRTETNLRKNKPRDAAKLKEMLRKAADYGIIENYWREPGLSDKHSRQRPVWNWTRPNKEAIKQRRKYRKKQQN